MELNGKTFFSDTSKVFGSFDPFFLLTFKNVPIPHEDTLDFLPESIRYSATIHHEEIHWHQFIGTNFGRILLLIPQSKYNLFFISENFKKKDSIFKDIPKIRIEKGFTINTSDAKTFSSDSIFFLEDWLSHSITYDFLLEGNSKFEDVGNLNKRLANTLAYTFQSINNFLRLKDSRKMTDIFNLFIFEDFGIPKFNNTILTVTDLLEGQAKMSELIHLSRIINVFENKSVPFRNQLDDLFYRHSEDNRYWRALDIFSQILRPKKIKAKNFSAGLLFLILIDIALAIPFPPFINPEVFKHLEWKDFYPPTRFLTLCHTTRTLDLEMDFDLNDNYKVEKFISKIANEAGYNSPAKLDYYFLQTHKERLLEIENKMLSEKNGNFSDFELFDYYMYVYKKSAESRINSPLVFSGAGLIDEFLPESDMWLDSSPLVIDVNKEHNKLYTPFINEKSENFHWLLLMFIVRKIVNDYLIFNRAIRTFEFPFDIPQWVKDQCQKEIFRLFNRKIIWQ